MAPLPSLEGYGYVRPVLDADIAINVDTSQSRPQKAATSDRSSRIASESQVKSPVIKVSMRDRSIAGLKATSNSSSIRPAGQVSRPTWRLGLALQLRRGPAS